jgi:hypothetical protein
VHWLDPEGLEVKANPLVRFVLRAEMRIMSEVGGIPRVIGVENAARGYLDDASVVNVAAALRRQVRNDPGKSNLAIPFRFWAFPGDENVASSPPSPQLRLLSGRQAKRPARPPPFGAFATSILVSAESGSSDDFI